jgi:hypothetical protein
MRIELRIQTLTREAAGDDDRVGHRLVTLLRAALDRGAAPPAAVIVRPEQFDLVLLDSLARHHVSPMAFLAALTRSRMDHAGPVEAVGVLGTFRAVRRLDGSPVPAAPTPPGVPMGMVFLEWGDGRWWHWRSLLEATTADLRDDTETLSRAVDGSPKPTRLGGWWSLGRRRELGLLMTRTAPELVH